MGQICHQVLHYLHVGQWIDGDVAPRQIAHVQCTGKGIVAVDVHRTGAADTFAAGAAERQRLVDFFFDLDERVQQTGPSLLTFAEAVAEIAEAAGREIRYVQIPHDAFKEGIAASGAPDDIAWLLDYLFSTVLDGRNAYVCDGVQRALGREPRDFAVYAREAAATGVWSAGPHS